MDWNLVQVFLQVVNSGSLSKAAEKMGLSQPTLSRQIQQLEEQLNLNLFERSTTGVVPTNAAKKLIESAEQMQQAADLWFRLSRGEDQLLGGTVRLSANEVVAHYLLPRLLAQFQQRFDIQVELVISNQNSSLSKREADVALRMGPVLQPDLVCKTLAQLPMGLYAHPTWLANQGIACFEVDKWPQLGLIGFDQDPLLLLGAKQLGVQWQKQQFRFRCDSMLQQIRQARCQGGMVLTHQAIGEGYSDLVPVPCDQSIPSLQMSLVCHGDVHYNASIQALMQFLSVQLEQHPYRNLCL